MIQKFKDYDNVRGYADFERLPKGGYIIKILGVSVERYRDNQDTLKLSCDVVEGEYKDFFANQYKQNTNEDKRWGCNLLLNVPNDDGSERDNWAKRAFKTAIEAIEESNAGYHWNWNEQTLKGLVVGGLFNEREYEGNDGNIRRSTNLARFCDTEKIRTGKYSLPKDRLIERPEAKAINDGFMDIPANMPDGLPFV